MIILCSEVINVFTFIFLPLGYSDRARRGGGEEEEKQESSDDDNEVYVVYMSFAVFYIQYVS